MTDVEIEANYKPGDRVRCYFGSPEGVAVRNASVEMPGEAKSVKGELGVRVILDEPVKEYDCEGDMIEISRMWVHIKQCRRLVKRKKPEAERITFNRKELWDFLHYSHAISNVCFQEMCDRLMVRGPSFQEKS
jgi:hypothetical protein